MNYETNNKILSRLNDSEDVKLKPCPFCGSTARAWGLGGYEFYSVECDNEECGCVYGDNLQLSFEEVIEAWNKRAGSEVQDG